MRLLDDKGELKVYFNAPKELDLEVFKIDDIDYNCHLFSLSEPKHINEFYLQPETPGFTIDKRGKYKLYNAMYFKNDEPRYIQSSWWDLGDPLKVKL